MSSVDDELEAIERSARGGAPGSAPLSTGRGRGRGGGASGGPRKRGSSQFMPPAGMTSAQLAAAAYAGAGRGVPGPSYGAGGSGPGDSYGRGGPGPSYGGGGGGGGGGGSGDELLVDFPGSDDEAMDESDDERYGGAPPSMKPGMGYGMPPNIPTGVPAIMKPMGGGALPTLPTGPRRGSGGMIMNQMAMSGGMGGGTGRHYDDSDDSSEEYHGGGYGPGYGANAQPGGYGGGPGLPGHPMPLGMPPVVQQPQRIGEAERVRLRQIQMEQEISTKSGTEDHRPLVGGFAAAAYEAARADHFQAAKTTNQKGDRPRDLPSI